MRRAPQARPRLPPAAFLSPPLLVMNGFAGPEHLRLASTLFQHLFPPISVQTVKLSNCHRVVLLNCNKETGELRFYNMGTEMVCSCAVVQLPTRGAAQVQQGDG